MIAHLSAAGVPVSWTITALYGSAFGVALCSARTWHRDDDTDNDAPQFVVEMTDGGDAGWKVVRTELLMDARHLSRQQPDDPAWLVQDHTAPVELPAALTAAIATALRTALVDFGYLIPRADWVRRYPASALTSKRFAEFAAADRAASDAGVPIPYEPRWSPFMEPETHERPPYGIGKDGDIVAIARNGVARAADRHDLAHIGDAAGRASAVRLLNSGWTPAEIAVLLTDEPVED